VRGDGATGSRYGDRAVRADAVPTAKPRRYGRTRRDRRVSGLRADPFFQEPPEDPDRDDLNSLWWDLVEKLQLVDRPPRRDEPDWAAKIHVAPVYFHNYVLEHLISAQLRNYLEAHVTRGPFYENEVAGRYLVESFFGPGARSRWEDLVLGATGERPNPDYFAKSLR
jgi:peptidyl-dipeptidase A